MSVLAAAPSQLGPGFRVEPAAHAVSAARRVISDLVIERELPLTDAARRDVALLSAEVITNAARHTGAACAVLVLWTGERLRVEVTDTDPELPTPRGLDPSVPHGRGLLLVAALAADWGAEPDPAGKRVWFEVGPDSRLDGEERLTTLVRVAAPMAADFTPKGST
ncbi:ATP-binding protein [Streptacidiphilus anmyonensis]|uniref:ATP-binding protein n=1 Tax=Streptacidiphilus anmyonensis TaxID=405782 RepID=UPI000694197F|nr:ATP-binding protein [Streptacidiphilus anmyonensis]